MSIELRIKSKHLALEPAIIKHEEAKIKRQIKWVKEKGKDSRQLQWKLESLINHRRFDVAEEQRATFIARAFIAGKPYKAVEPSRKNEYAFRNYILPRVRAMVVKYGNREAEQGLTTWLNT